MKRQPIPDDIKLKLWVLSGGRCEFPGCNEYVWQDKLTLKSDNFAHIAHIVAASPDGPRGDIDLSPKLITNFDNILLVCLVHSKLVDGKNKCDYTIEELQNYKKSHEDRIRIQTSLKPEMRTTVLRFMANIGDRPVQIGLADTYQAILPRFPSNDRGISIDFTNRPGRGQSSFWDSFSGEIGSKVEWELTSGNIDARPSHLSVFALGPIPLLIRLGHSIGNTISANLFQRHRDTEDWKWKPEDLEPFEYTIREVAGIEEKHIALVLSLSGKIHEAEVYQHFGTKPYLYEITIDTPNPGFLNQESKLKKFRDEYRRILSLIRSKHGAETTIHLFSAIPAPIAVLCGRELLPKSDPSMIVYDHEKEKGGFISILKIN